MKVLILETHSAELKKAIIREGKSLELPTMNDGWIFNFQKHAKNKSAYILVKQDTPQIIEGCMIFSLNKIFGPFLDYLEVAQHNKGVNGKFKRISDCLIAFACGLSFEKGTNENKGILTFQAYSSTDEGKIKLEQFYLQKFKAIINPWGYMEIHSDESRELIEEYLNRNEEQ